MAALTAHNLLVMTVKRPSPPWTLPRNYSVKLSHLLVNPLLTKTLKTPLFPLFFFLNLWAHLC